MNIHSISIKTEFVIKLSKGEFQHILDRDQGLYRVESYGSLLTTKLYDVINLSGISYNKNDGPVIYFTLVTSMISDLPTKLAEIEKIVKDYIQADKDSK